MNENEIGRLMDSYKEFTGVSSKRPLVRRRASKTWIPLTAGLVVGLFAALMVMWPRDAAAEAVKQVGLALKDVRTMRVKSYTKRFGKWELTGEKFYKAGMWRWDTPDLPMAGTRIQRDGQEFLSLHQLPFATVEPLITKELPLSFQQLLSGQTNLLESSLQNIKIGPPDVEPALTLQNHAPVKGRPTYLIVLDRPVDYYHAEILVDQKTHLPLKLEFKNADARRYEFRSEFSYDIPLPDSLFVFSPGKPVIDKQQALKSLERRWQNEMAVVKGAKVRDVCVADDGTLWIATSSIGERANYILPTWIVTSGGVPYVRLPVDYSPSAFAQKQSRARVQGEGLMLTAFVPLRQPNAPPSEIAVRFAFRLSGHVPPELDHAPIEIKPVVKLPVRREPDDLPSYFTPLDLDTSRWMIQQGLRTAKAKELERRGAWREAAAAWEEAALEVNRSSKWSFVELKGAARCYAEAGDTAAAKDALRRSRAADYRPLLGLPVD